MGDIMLNRKFFLSLVLIIAGVTFLGAAYATKWDHNWGPGSLRIKGQPSFKESRLNTIKLTQALKLAENESGGKAQSIYLRNMHGYLVYVAEIVTPDNSAVKTIVDAGDGRILFVETQKKILPVQ
jgi:hypothetical protein